jgi:2,4-dienoyl-CoA reductase-like NADH-dependent reductase (Old Yellow Enzyme family)
MKFAKPRAATQEDIDHVIECFAHAAEFLYRAGFDGVELHGAHGYLISQFLSPCTNLREDHYGGSLHNRTRMILEIAAAIRARLPPNSGFIIGIKVNSVEFQSSGRNFTVQECRTLCSILETEGRFDFVELSGGSYEGSAFEHNCESSKKREAFFLEFADAIAPMLTKTKLFVTAGFRTVAGMVKALDMIDGIGLARPLAQEPRLVGDILSGGVQGAIEQLLDQSDIGLTNLTAGSMMRQVGWGEEPMDFSEEGVVRAFMEMAGKWMERLGGDTEGKMYGYVDVEGGGRTYGSVVA